MTKNLFLSLLITALLICHCGHAQVEPAAGNWKTWFISSGKEYRLPKPPSYKEEVAQILSAQQTLSTAGKQQIVYWNAGAPGYHWQEMMSKLWTTDISNKGALANMLLNVASYDATVAAWDTKYAYNRPRPAAADKRITTYGLNPNSPSYPCEYSVAAGVAVTIISHFYPTMADSVKRMATALMTAKVAAGTAFPSDTRAGFELGQRIAEKEIEHTKDYVTKATWNGKIPEGKAVWTGRSPMLPVAGLNKTVVLDSGSQLRPPPPPDFAKEMAELKSFKQNFRSQANAFYWASSDFWGEALNKKIFENNYHLNPPKAARLYAITAITAYDCFIACFDAKYAYWGIRPNQYDTTYHSLVPTPPFPGYPSGHAMMSGMFSELYAYLFPEDAAYFRKKAIEAAESRFQAGIHFRTDNEVGLDLGRKVAAAVIQKIREDNTDAALPMDKQRTAKAGY